MKEHLIPQDITGYRFHIIGSMTLAQFAQILLGVAIGFIFYQTNLPSFIKLPLAAIFVLTGFAAAFVPIEGRPLSDWIINFAKALYKPTRYYWQKEARIPDAFAYQPGLKTKQKSDQADLTPAKKERIEQFLDTITKPRKDLDAFDLTQKKQVSQVLDLFQESKAAGKPVKKAIKPDLKLRTRKIAPAPQGIPIQQQAAGQTEQADPASFSEANEKSRQKTQPQIQAAPQTEKRPESESAPPKPNHTNSSTQASQPQLEQQQQQDYNSSVSTAQQSQDLPFPNKPSQPNKIVGMILSADNELADNALVEIQNNQRETITAVKSNALGQFHISRQLKDGQYFIKVQKPGLEFEPQKIKLTGKVVDPIKITSTN